MNTNFNIGDRGSFLIALGDNALSCKDAILQQININYGYVDCYSSMEGIFKMANGMNEVQLNFACRDINSLFAPVVKIRDKRVEDCTIQELLFAIRQKIK